MLGLLKQLEDPGHCASLAGFTTLRKDVAPLVEPEHLEARFPTTIQGDRAEVAPLKFSFREDEAPPMKGEMITYESPSVLEFKWGEDVLRFELQAVKDGTF